MKTVIQELIEELKANDVAHGMFWIKRPSDFFEKYLEKEKEQIKNVFEHCWNHPNWKGQYDIRDMEDYLKNYNKNK